MPMNIVLWILQVLVAVAFLFTGFRKVLQPERAAGRMGLEWIPVTTRNLMLFIGASEILGGLGLILPTLTGILPWLTPLAAVCLGVVMLMALGFNVMHGKLMQSTSNVILLALVAIIAYGRFAIVPV